tara:strand:+ start:652 stop:810 length:159 start_codon:yes stop_codon:yes gene_type:complete
MIALIESIEFRLLDSITDFSLLEQLKKMDKKIIVTMENRFFMIYLIYKSIGK